MKSKKGQALVEFIIILPVSLILFFCIADIARVIMTKNELEGITDDAITLYESGKTIDEVRNIISKDDKDVIVDIYYENDYTSLNVNKKIKPITPGFSYVLKDVFDVKTKRVIKNE